jgi:hypothetical protein
MAVVILSLLLLTETSNGEGLQPRHESISYYKHHQPTQPKTTTIEEHMDST